jgi:endoglucanase
MKSLNTLLSKTKIIGLLNLVLLTDLKATEIIEVRPLTNKILMVHFDDGYVQHHTAGQQATDDLFFVDPLNTDEASTLANYIIYSLDDENYNTPSNPIDIGRKSKGTEFAVLCEEWGYIPYFNDVGCINTSPDHAKEHWIYLFLPSPMAEGKNYTLSTNNLASNENTFSFTYISNSFRSDAMHVNQIGYSAEAPQKFGYVYNWMGDKGSLELSNYAGNLFHLIDQTTNTIVFTDSIQFRKDSLSIETAWTNETPSGNFLGGEVYECDFSGFNTTGSYVLSVEGIGCSYPFEIACDAKREPFKYTMQGIYQNRSGIDLVGSYVQNRPAPHNVIVTPGFAGKLKYTNTKYCDVSNSDASEDDKVLWESGIQGDLTETWGWYQDAGDWDAYMSHLRVPTYLMFLFENFSENFSDGELEIPESGNGQPDVLDEARWLLRFYKRLKDELVTKGWGTGGVGGSRIMGDLWGSDSAPDGTERGSWQDTTRIWIVSGEDAFITLWYAGIAAHYAYCLQKVGLEDIEGINWQNESIEAYNWAQNNLTSETDCQGYNLNQLRMYASASLFKLTGLEQYNNQFVEDFNIVGISSTDNELSDVRAYGTWQYATLPENITPDETVVSTALASIEATADFQLISSFIEGRACRWGGNFWFPMVVGQGTTPIVRDGVMGYAILKNTNPSKALEYLKTLHNTADYFLGNNPLNTTWITGLGENYPTGIFHMDSFYSSSGGVRRGIVPYGPWRREYYGPYGSWRNDWPALTTYPDYELFPGHERWFDQRTAPLGCEFTIDQTNLSAAFLYGAISCENEVISGFNQNIANNNKFRIYPNPAESFVYLQGTTESISNISTINGNGKMIQLAYNKNKNTIDTSKLSNGIYFITIKTVDNQIYSLKLIKM